MYQNIVTEIDQGVGIITLNRADRHNAFDDAMIDEISVATDAMAVDASVRVVVFSSTGKSFCAGADLNWMKRMAGYSSNANLQEQKILRCLLRNN